MIAQAREARQAIWPHVLGSAVRSAFGVIWAIDAYLKWQPAFTDHFVGYLQNAAQGQPDWLQPWFSFWIALVSPQPDLFVAAVRIIETAIAAGLLLGLARKWTYIVGLLYSLLIWSTAEGFGGPYILGATDIGPGMIYVLVFISLAIIAMVLGRTPYSVDYYLENRNPSWARVAEFSPERVVAQQPPRLPWPHQLAAIGAIILAFIVFTVTFESAMSTAPATPENAAAAVSPLSLASSTPVAAARDATLPPLIGTGDSVSVDLASTDNTVEIASGVQYQAWTFGGT
ncbi:MAG: nitrite reductase, partial [Rudaea sp.]